MPLEFCPDGCPPCLECWTHVAKAIYERHNGLCPRCDVERGLWAGEEPKQPKEGR